METERTKCKIATIDCNSRGIVPSEISSRIVFLPVCLGGKDTFKGKREFVTYETLLRRLNVTHNPIFLKMDIEGMLLYSFSQSTVAFNLMSQQCYI